MKNLINTNYITKVTLYILFYLVVLINKLEEKKLFKINKNIIIKQLFKDKRFYKTLNAQYNNRPFCIIRSASRQENLL